MRKVIVESKLTANGATITGTYYIYGQFHNNASNKMNYVLYDVEADEESELHIVELNIYECRTFHD